MRTFGDERRLDDDRDDFDEQSIYERCMFHDGGHRLLLEVALTQRNSLRSAVNPVQYLARK